MSSKFVPFMHTHHSMSLGGGASTSLDNAVNAAVNKGVHFAVAAGNENSNACNSSPARASNPLVISSVLMMSLD